MSPAISPVAYYNYQPSASAVVVMKPALEFADDTNFEELKRERKRQSSFSDRLLLSLLRPLNKSLNEAKESVMQMTQQEAQSGLNDLAGYEVTIGEVKEVVILNSDYLENLELSEIEREMFQLLKSVVVIFDEIKLVAEGGAVDEESEDYQDFIGRLVAESASTPIKHGKRALYDLFKD